MLVTLGARNRVDDLVDLLAACHRRIRQHVVLARRLAVLGPHSPPQEVRDTASQIRRYFAIALPLHVADEDQTIAPRLRELDADVGAAVARVAIDHAGHQRLVDELVELCAEVERDPARLAAIESRLAKLVEILATELASHLELEERVVFPALRSLPVAVRAEIRDEIVKRRGNPR